MILINELKLVEKEEYLENTEEMKEDFHAKVDRASTKTKIEYLLTKVDYYHYILVHAKKRLELFRNLPLLDLLINHYKFYRDVFMIIGFFKQLQRNFKVLICFFIATVY